MIPPNLLSISLTFTAVPIWQWEPVDRPAPEASPAQGTEAEAAASSGTNAAAFGEPACAPAPAELGRVFKGYEWRPVAVWECLALPEWDRWVDNKRDESAASARGQERSRNVVSLRVPVVLPLPGGEPPAAIGSPAPEADAARRATRAPTGDIGESK